MSKRLLILNGSIRGSSGNTGELIELAREKVPAGVETREIVLATYDESVEALAEEIRLSHGLLVGTGVYWGSWGSPLQRFLEVMSAFETSELFVGKPVGTVVTMDSVGGMDVAERLLGVFSTLGCMIPPLTMLVVSRLATALRDVAGNEDVWQVDDVDALVQNLVLAMSAAAVQWRSWPVVRTSAFSGRYPATGLLDLGNPRFLRNLGRVGGRERDE